MTLVEYVNSLFEQGLSGEEVIAKTQEWKKKNQPKEEEVKIEGVAETTDATVPPKTPDASENLESGNGQSQLNPNLDLINRRAENKILDDARANLQKFEEKKFDFNKIHENVFGKSIEESEKDKKKYKQDQINSILKKHKPGTPERTIAYYQLELAPDETINKDLYSAYDKYQKDKKEGEQFSDFITRTQQEALEIAEKQRKEKIAKMTTAEQAEAVFLNNIPIQLEQQWEDTKAAFVNWISSVAGSDAADFLVGKMPDESIVFVDPETNEEVDFDENPEKWKELNTRNMGAEEIKTRYKGTDTNVGKFAEDYIIERFKESEELGKGIIDVGNIVDKFDLEDGVDIEFTSGRELFGGILNAIGSTVSTVIPAALTRGASLFPQVAAPMYVDYNVQKAKSLYGDDPEALDKLVRNKQAEVVTPLALGGVAVGLEYVGFKGIMKNLIGKTNLLKPLTTMVLTQNREGLTEVGQAVTEKVNEGLGKGKSITVALTDAITDPKNAKYYLENYMMGVVGSGVMIAPTSLSRSVNSALITETEVFNNATKLIQEVSSLQLQKSQSGNKAFKEAIDLQIQEKEQSLKDLLENTNKLTNLMTKEEQTEVLDLLGQKKKNNETLIELNESLSKGEITAQQYGSAKGGISSSNKSLTNKVDRVLANANKRLIEGEVAVVEDIAGKENVETFNTVDEFVEATGQNGKVDAFIDKSGKIFINKQRAAEVGAITAGSHELLHRILKSTFESDPNTALKLVESFKNTLSSKELNVIQKRIDENYRYDKDGNERPLSEYAEEYLTSFSDAIGKGEITYKDNLKETFMRLAKPILDIFRPRGYNKLNFKDGRDVYNFIKDYQKNIKKGKISERAQKLQELEEVDLGTVKKSVTKESKRKLTPEQDKQAQDKVKEIQDLQKESEALAEKYNKPFIKGAKQQRLEKELFGSDVKATIDSFVEDRTKALYDPIPASNKENLTRQQFIESMKSDIETMVIGEFEAKQPLEKFITSRGYLRANSLAERLGVASIEEGITKSIDDTTKQIIGEETTETAVEADDLAKKPTETTSFNKDLLTTDFLDTIKVEETEAINEINKDLAEEKITEEEARIRKQKVTKNVIENKITQTITRAYKGRDVKGFKDLGSPKFPIPKSVAQLYADMFGIKTVDGLTKKAQNFYPRDREGLRNLQRFLIENSLSDYNRLPKTISDFGKATGIKQTKLGKIMYNDKGVKVGTAKQYRDIMQGKNITLTVQNGNQKGQPIEFNKPVKDISRGDLQQNLKTAWDFHVKNRALETLVPEQGKRIQAGAKFSVTQKAEISPKLEKLFKEVSQANSIIDVANIIGVKGKITVNDSNRAQKQEQMLDFIKAGNIPSAVFEMAKFQNFARRKVNGVYVDLPARGGLYYGKSDPAYQAALNAAKENDSKYPDLAKPKRVNVNNAFTKEGINQSKENTKFLNSFVNILNDAVNKNNLPIEIAALYITSGYQATTGIIKIAAPFKYKSTKFEYAGKDASKASDNKGEKFREEHTIPASVIGANIILAIQKNAVKPTMKAIEKNYFQVQLSKKDDTKLDKAGLGSTLFENQTIFDSPISRLAAAGINLQTIVNPLNGKTIAEENGVSIESKVYNSLDIDGKTQASAIQNEQIKKGALDKDYNVKEAIDLLVPLSDNKAKASKRNSNTQPDSLQEGFVPVEKSIENLDVLDGALNQARRPDAPVKKIRVFDFDDTLARSKSQVLYTVPNVEGGFSEGATNLKAIFMVGGPGAGKTNVGKGLQLGRRGYKVVNQDIALEAMKAESGLPAKESDYTAEQRSLRSKLGAAARKAAVAKFDKYAAAGNGMVIDGTGASYNATTKKIKALKDLGYEVHMVVATTPLETAIERNKARAERSLPDFVVKKTYESVQESLKKYREDFGDRLYEINTETIEYGKPLPNDFLQQVYAGINANKVGKVDATSFAENYDVLESQGAEFDFREFSKVIEGQKGPLFSVAQKIAKARGTEDIFILTARPADAAKPIQEFMKANGIDIPLQNITGLGDGTAAAKGRWIASKAAEGYNDFYFADDAIKNVEAVKEVLSQVDVKSKVQQAKFSKTKTFDKVFNDIIEAKTGIESYKDYSAAKAKTVGANKGKFTFFTTPSAEDFLGLLYKTLGKGKVGDAQMAFYKENLLDPFNRAEMAISQAKVAAGRDYKALKKQFKGVPKTLEKETGISKYTYQHAIRTYIWDTQGLEVPGLSKRDQKRLTDFIKADPELQAFADQLVNIQKGKPYPKPDKDWTAGNITTDVISGINKVNRAEYLQEWQENVDIIFSEKNMNKLEAAFGAKYVEALKDSLRAMKSGSNRPLGGDRVSNQILDWLNNSVGAIMFLNTRSAVLQTISAVNFINWGDNNILKAGKAFANQKQFWGDFLTLMNSDYLLERRDGLKINVSESEIADAVEGSDNKVKAAISYLLNKGFVFTRYADSFAIASGGATFYRNRIESLVEQGMDRKLAEQQAFEDFRLIAEENQQSSSPMRISQQQRSLIGRIVLQFGNTQLQYVRIQKRAVQDLVNGRGDWRANISKIVYYGAIQNLLFNALQSGLAWALFDDDEDDDDQKKPELTKSNKEQKLQRALNGAIDSQLKGLGIQGAVIAGVKNALITIAEQNDKKSPKFEEALDDLLSIAPALGSKIRKLKSAARTVSWNRKEIKEKGFSMDNPAYLAGAQVISAVFNIPLDRAAMKINNMRNILNPATENWQKVALALGWSTWDVGLPYFGLAEAEPVLTETQKQVQKLFNLNKSDQVKMLLDLGLTKKEIRALTKEQQRVDEIIKLQNKKKDAGSKK